MAARTDQTLRRVAAAALDQIQALAPDASEVSSARVPPTTARDHLGQVLYLLTDVLQTLERPTNTRAGSLAEHLADRQHAEATIRELIRSVVGTDSPESLLPQVHRLIADLKARLGAPDLPAAVESLFGVVKLVDYLRGALIEAAASAMRFRQPIVPAAAVEATRALTMVLGARFPGAVLELRVPPAAAVQLGAFGAGPSHTRGTPPNVIEMDPLVFIGLATGLKQWPKELAAHSVQASGTQVDVVERMLPVIQLHR